ncbi:hypothetical protein BG004_004314 [Podila humilis]|nr:hypothetical protein BG004_004314 [Podila humilis]
MDSPIDGDKYVRTLSHYLRSNQRRLLPQPTPPPNGNATARAILTPGDPMAAAYQNMMSSLWTATTAMVDAISSSPDGRDTPPDKDLYKGAWDGTGSITADTSPRERQLHQQAQLKAPILPLDLYYVMYILERFEEAGIDLDLWDGLVPRTIGDSTPRVITKAADGKTALPNSTTAPTPIPAPAVTRPQSIRSFQSTAISTLTLITGWKQWSTAASSQENVSITDDVHFIHRFLKKVPGLRLVSNIPLGVHVQGRGRIEGFNTDAILSLLSGAGQTTTTHDLRADKRLLLPVLSLFPALTHLELHKIPPRSVDGWEVLMKQLRSLVMVQADIEDVYDVMVTAVVDSERRRRQRHFKEQNRATQIKQEQQEALKEATLVSKGVDTVQQERDRDGQENDGSTVSINGGSLDMWPHLRYLSFPDNGFPALAHSNTFSYTQAVVSLDLSHNLLLAPPSGLIHLHNLQELNLAYNMISGVQSIYQILGNISVLDLKGNRLESLSGLERLWNLEKVDVRENHLDEAAEVGRLAALPQIREVWADRNPFCVIQQKHRLEILAVFKANGHDLLLDGTFASFTERRSLANLSPSDFSTTISSINNLANIPAASAPAATLAKELSSHTHHPHSDQPSGDYSSRPVSWHVSTLPGDNGVQSPPVSKLVKKKLMRASNRVKRVVNLDSDHEEEAVTVTAVNEYGEPQGVEILLSDDEGGALPSPKPLVTSVLGSPAAMSKRPKKKKSPKSPSPDPADTESLAIKAVKDTSTVATTSLRVKKKAPKKKSINFAIADNDDNSIATSTTATSTAAASSLEDSQTTVATEDNLDHSLCRGNNHVHRLAHLERSMANIQFERSTSNNSTASAHNHHAHVHAHGQGHGREPSKGVLKRAQTFTVVGVGATSGMISPRPGSPMGLMRPSSPIGSMSSDDGGADGYRRRIEAMRNEAGSNWLRVLAEMDKDILHTQENTE